MTELKNSRMDTNDDKKRDKTDKIKNEIDKLVEKGHIQPSDLIELNSKYGESAVDSIVHQVEKKHRHFRKQVKELATRVARKYSDGRKPLHVILDKMMKYKTKHHWTNQQYDEFRKALYEQLSGTKRMNEIDLNNDNLQYRSRITKTLGMTMTTDTGFKIKSDEQSVLAEILSMRERSAAIHRNTFMSSLMYEDCSIVAMSGEFDRTKHVSVNHIHPLIAAMFLPKIKIFETQMLYSNFGEIIHTRNQGKQVVNEPDIILLHSITSDPNDVVCETSSPITDLKNRYNVQISLWKTVQKLREGLYYDADSTSEFLTNLNLCRNNLYENADLSYNQDEGSILKKLLSVFSLRPTFIKTSPLNSLSAFTSPLSLGTTLSQPSQVAFNMGVGNMIPFNTQPVYTITCISMISLNLPPFDENDTVEKIDLSSSRTQTIWINEKGTIVPKEQSIHYSKDVLIFYVNRRVHRMTFKTFANPIPFTRLPLMMNSFDRVNKYPVGVQQRLHIKTLDEMFELRSVVCVKETELNVSAKLPNSQNIITGCCALIKKHSNPLTGDYGDSHYIYDPVSAAIPVELPGTPGAYTNSKPVSFVDPYFTNSMNGYRDPSFFERAETTGTIFIYAKPSGSNYAPDNTFNSSLFYM